MKILRVLIIVAVLGLLLLPIKVMAASTATIIVTNSPYFVSVTITPSSWSINGLTGSGLVNNATTYYSNPLGDTLSPTVGGATNSQCYFNAANGMAIAVDLTVTSSNFSGGSDNSTNSNNGTAGATSYGAYTYFSGQTNLQWVICKSAGSSIGYSNLGSGGNVNFGLIIAEQTNAWSGGTPSSSTITVTSSAH
jgi:hypothetical protein